MNKLLVETLRDKFHQRLQAKTGWGRNDVMQEFEKAVNESLLELLDAKDQRTAPSPENVQDRHGDMPPSSDNPPWG